MVLLAKYGGIYSDSDVILIQNIVSLGNVITRQTEGTSVNSAFMNFSSHEPILEYAIDAMQGSLSTAGYFSVLVTFKKAVEEYCLKNCPRTFDIRLLMNVSKLDATCCNVTLLGKLGIYLNFLKSTFAS